MSEEPIPVMIADDEEGIRLILRKRIEKTPGFILTCEAADGEEALRLFDEKRPKVVFLDVDMPGLNGLELARQIQDRAPTSIIIFATGHEEYREEAFEVYAFDYLVKPFRLERLDNTLQRVLAVTGRKGPAPVAASVKVVRPAVNGRIMLRHKDGISFLGQQDILLVQREDRSTVFYTRDGSRYETADTLSEAMEKLDPSLFFRCHKSYIVNLSKIRNITPYGRWTYVIQLEDTRQDALITRDKYEELEKLFS